MPSSLCRHGGGLLLLLILLVATTHGDDDNYAAPACRQKPFICGTVNITYPFYLPNEPDGESSYCGYPGLAVRCDGGTKAVLRLGADNYTYTVSRIDYDNLTVSLADATIAAAGTCPTVDHNVTIPPSAPGAPLFLRASAVDYLFFFFDCSFGGPKPAADDEPKPPKPPAIKPITCGGGGGSDSDKGPGSDAANLSFVVPRADVPCGDWSSRAYRAVFEVPVLQDSIPRGARDDPEWRNGGYGAALRSGFQVGWERSSSGPCSQCEQGGGKCGYSRDGKFLGCICADGRVGGADGCSSKIGVVSDNDDYAPGNPKRTKIYIVASTSCLLLLCLITLALYLTYKYSSLLSKTKDARSIESFLRNNGNIHPKRYTYAEVKKMTKSFAVKLGQGGFGAVYRGNLLDGREVAVKMLKDNKGDGEGFMNEVSSISRTSHVNVVTLLGFCLEGQKRALIYEYMSNGSLERYAFNNFSSESTFTWEKLFEIAIGIARGLEYLHRGCNTRIVHFDIKPHNILLDQDFCPKISDFGLSKLCFNKESAISIVGARGTIGYIAPEVYSKQFGIVSSKSDVYSYGMMVLEMVGARDKNNTSANSESSSQYFPQWIYEHLDDYCISASEINGETTELVRKMIVVGLWCIQLTPTNRPTMTRVVEMLEGSTSTLELPPRMLLS